ncbi:hypothetical protein NE237_028331 [Protea cynaroides]|uniref:Uncharacterized protein n=1 Tax=Protea cynaroides TaxID=273540 RepID=A0A9Q0JSR8_9MAGN|nr:hypothetical protein NE237_028331 [Protea cynaroides]
MEKVSLGFMNTFKSNICFIQLVRDEDVWSYESQVAMVTSMSIELQEEKEQITMEKQKAEEAVLMWASLEVVKSDLEKGFDFSKIKFNVDTPTNSDEVEDAPNQQMEGTIDQQLEEALVELQKEVAAEKAAKEIAEGKTAATKELAEHPRDFMDTEEVGNSFQVEE